MQNCIQLPIDATPFNFPRAIFPRSDLPAHHHHHRRRESVLVIRFFFICIAKSNREKRNKTKDLKCATRSEDNKIEGWELVDVEKMKPKSLTVEEGIKRPAEEFMKEKEERNILWLIEWIQSKLWLLLSISCQTGRDTRGSLRRRREL